MLFLYFQNIYHHTNKQTIHHHGDFLRGTYYSLCIRIAAGLIHQFLVYKVFVVCFYPPSSHTLQLKWKWIPLKSPYFNACQSLNDFRYAPSTGRFHLKLWFSYVEVIDFDFFLLSIFIALEMDMTVLALYLTVIWLTIHAYYNMKQRSWNLQKKNEWF